MHFEKPDKKFCLLIVLAYTAGVLFSIFLMKNGERPAAEKAGLFSDYALNQYSCLEINRKELMCIVAKERGKWLLLMWAVGFTWAGVYLVYAFSAVWGFFCGILVMTSFLRKGIWGIVLALLFGMPQMLIYIPLWLWFLYIIHEKSSLCRKMKKIGAVSRNNQQYVIFLLAGAGVLVLGILTESYLNSWIIQQVLRMF